MTTTKNPTALEKSREKEMTVKQKKMTTLSDLLNDPVNKKKIAMGAPKYLNSDSLIRIALTAVQKNDKLMQCTAGSILQACMDCAAYGLMPSSSVNEAHLVPFGDQATLIVGYKGLIKLATNTGLVSHVEVSKVHKNDEFRIEKGTNKQMKHIPAVSDPGEYIGSYAVVVFTSGHKDWEYISKEQGIEHGKRFSKNFNSKSSTWKLDLEAMINKTIVRMALKYVPASPENLHASQALAKAITADEIMETKGVIDVEPAEQKEEIPAPKPLAENTEQKEKPVTDKKEKAEPKKKEKVGLETGEIKEAKVKEEPKTNAELDQELFAKRIEFIEFTG